MALDATSESRLSALAKAPLNRWIALSADETRIIADGETFKDVVAAAERIGEDDPLIMRVPKDWTPRVL